MKLRTWHKEAIVVGGVLVAVAVARGLWTEILGSLAVFFTFMHAQVSFRMAEAEERRTAIEVECYWKAQYFFLAKEAMWFCYFLTIGAYSALIGVFVFLFYPIWRRYHLKRRGRA